MDTFRLTGELSVCILVLKLVGEKRPADGYATADSIEFTIEDSGEVQSVQMKDDTTKIRLIKLAGNTGQGLRGAKFEVYDSNDKKVLNIYFQRRGLRYNWKAESRGNLYLQRN